MVWKLILTIVSSTTVAALVQYFVTRHDNKKNLEGRMVRLEKDGLRTQMLVLILMKPDAEQEILTIAEHYFKDLHGDWYMTSIFNKWVEEQGIAEPEWFKGGIA